MHSLTIPPGAGLVGRPYHGQQIEVEELAPTSRRALVIAHPLGIMRALHLVPVIWNRPVHAIGDQGRSAQNIPDRHYVDDWQGLWLIEVPEYATCRHQSGCRLRRGMRPLQNINICTNISSVLIAFLFEHLSAPWCS